MPSPWKKARLVGISRLLISSLHSKAKRGVADSPLVLQTGFPTSVADLLVKNRSRLRKPPHWRRHPDPGSAGGADAGCSTMAILVSEIVAAASAAADHRLPAPPRSPPPEVAEGDGSEAPHGLLESKVPKVECFEDPQCSKPEKDEIFIAPAPPKAPETHPPASSLAAAGRWSEASGAPSVAEGAERKVPGGGVAKVAFLVLILAVVSKKIAIAISILAFGILLAESIWRRLIPWLRPCEEAKRGLGSDLGAAELIQTRGSLDLDSQSNGGLSILLARLAEIDLGSFRSETDWDAEGPGNALETMSPASEGKENIEIRGDRGDREPAGTTKGGKKRRRLFRNFVPTKFRGGKGVKGGKMEGNVEHCSDSGGGESLGRNCIEEEAFGEEEDEEEEEEEGRGFGDENKNGEGEVGLGLQIPPLAHDVGLGGAAFMGAKMCEPAKGSLEHLVFFVVVLSGLIGGRVAALVLTVIWLSLVSSARCLWRSWNSHRKAVPDASTAEALRSGGEE